jgi:methyltransferase
VTSAGWFVALVAVVVAARLVELVVARRHLRWALDRGGVEHGAGHYPAMVVMHAAFLACCLLEVLLADRPFVPVLGWPALALLVAAHALRWWCIVSLGKRWTTRVVVLPGAPPITRGPYRWLRHPNYVAVAAEIVALPLVHTAWATALVFTGLNAVLLLGFRIPAEERALAGAPR